MVLGITVTDENTATQMNTKPKTLGVGGGWAPILRTANLLIEVLVENGNRIVKKLFFPSVSIIYDFLCVSCC